MRMFDWGLKSSVFFGPVPKSNTKIITHSREEKGRERERKRERERALLTYRHTPKPMRTK